MAESSLQAKMQVLFFVCLKERKRTEEVLGFLLYQSFSNLMGTGGPGDIETDRQQADLGRA